MPNDKQAPRELKVTDKRIFTPDGEIRDEFKEEITPAAPDAAQTGAAAAAPSAPPAEPPAAAPPPPPADDRRQRQDAPPRGEERRRTMKDKAENPGTPFTNFVEPLIAQGYMSLGMLRDPYRPQAKTDPAAARQMIEILTLLRDKTRGNLTEDEEDFLETHLGELKLAFVQRTKTI